jgi:Family of unknown function (DUF6011)
MNFAPDKELNDSLADLIGGVDEEKAANPVAPPANYVPGTGKVNKFKETRLYTETCRKCRGTGRYNGPSTHGSRCFECDGVGTKTFKSSPESRAAKRAQVTNRKAKIAADAAAIAAEAATAFRAANPEICAWIDLKAPTFGFAASMQGAIAKWGHLTQGQIDACRKLIAGDAQRAKEAAERAANAPVADQAGVDRLKAAFDHAAEYARERGRGITGQRITIGGMVISPAKATSSNPGALYVKNGGEYLGKVQDGRFRRVAACTEAQEKQVLAFIADPKAAAIAYGIETGVCCICNATLTNNASIEAGIGPICATKMGW